MSITKELVREALIESHKDCANEDRCPLAEPFNENQEGRARATDMVMGVEADRQTKDGEASVPQLVDAAIFEGVHIGYRLRKLEENQQSEDPKDEPANDLEPLSITELMTQAIDSLAHYISTKGAVEKSMKTILAMKEQGVSISSNFDGVIEHCRLAADSLGSAARSFELLSKAVKALKEKNQTAKKESSAGHIEARGSRIPGESIPTGVGVEATLGDDDELIFSEDTPKEARAAVNSFFERHPDAKEQLISAIKSGQTSGILEGTTK